MPASSSGRPTSTTSMPCSSAACGAGEDLAGCVVAAHGVDGDGRASGPGVQAVDRRRRRPRGPCTSRTTGTPRAAAWPSHSAGTAPRRLGQPPCAGPAAAGLRLRLLLLGDGHRRGTLAVSEPGEPIGVAPSSCDASRRRRSVIGLEGADAGPPGRPPRIAHRSCTRTALVAVDPTGGADAGAVLPAQRRRRQLERTSSRTMGRRSSWSPSNEKAASGSVTHLVQLLDVGHARSRWPGPGSAGRCRPTCSDHAVTVTPSPRASTVKATSRCARGQRGVAPEREALGRHVVRYACGSTAAAAARPR